MHCAVRTFMTLGYNLHRPIDPPHVLERVRENLPLVDIVCHQIRRQLGRTLRMEDIVSYGREGLLAAARTFDAARGVPFRRWANIRVRGAVIDGVRANSALPRSVYARLRATDGADRARDGLAEEEAGRPPRSQEDADKRISEYLAGVATAIAIGFASASPDDHGEATDRTPNAEERFARAQLLARIHESIHELPDAERTLLERHYFDDVTFEQAAAELGLSKSWASRLHTRAVETVARSLKRAHVA
jgi:RNA polymerase sigma factor for flagellar operon FliA